jgi:hypothetical protein
MFLRALLFATLFFALSSARSQEALTEGLLQRMAASGTIPATSAWLDLRQNAAVNSNPQAAPAWVESVTLVSLPAGAEVPTQTVFRIRVSHPRTDLQMLLVRLFFDDKPEQRPTIVAWDESGTQVLRSDALGAGTDLATSDTVIVPMMGVTCIDVEVSGDGKTVRGVFMDWMTSSTVARPLSADRREMIPEPFSAVAPLRAPEQDNETFGTVTATLAPETI